MTNMNVMSAAPRRGVVVGVCLPDDATPRRGSAPVSSCQLNGRATTAAVLGSRAVSWAAERADQTDRGLFVIVVAPPRPEGAALLPVDTACVGAELADVVVARRPGLSVTVEIVHGDPVDYLTGASEDADLVVLDATGDGVSDAVVARARCPVTVVPSATRAASASPPPDAPVVVGVKDLAGSAHLVRFAALEALRAQRPLLVLHSWTYPGPQVHDEAMTVLGQEKTRLLRHLVDPIAEAIPEVSVRAEVVQGRAEETLITASRSAALVVLGSREERWRSPRLLGPTRRRILDSVACPAATVPDAPASALAIA